MFDDEIMVLGDEEIGVSLGVDQILVSLPLHLVIYTEENISQLQSDSADRKTLGMILQVLWATPMASSQAEDIKVWQAFYGTIRV